MARVPYYRRPEILRTGHRLKQDTRMFNYQINNIETAPEKSKPLLELFMHAIGFVPNLAGAIANSPVLANSLLGLFKNVHGGSFTEAEVQVLLLTNAVTNSSSWPVAFHSALSLKQGIDPADIQAIRERQLPKQKRYAALSGLAKKLIEKRGQLADDDVTAFWKPVLKRSTCLKLSPWSQRRPSRTMQAKSRIHHWRLFCKNTLGVDSPGRGFSPKTRPRTFGSSNRGDERAFSIRHAIDRQSAS